MSVPRFDPNEDPAGLTETTIGDATVRTGDKVVLRPGHGRDPQDFLIAGKTATIERIYVDYEDNVHLAVTVDDDPGQELMRLMGRYLFFNPLEVEVVPES